jgi:hypothetical protein
MEIFKVTKEVKRRSGRLPFGGLTDIKLGYRTTVQVA